MPQWALQMMGPYALGVSVLKPLLTLPNLKSYMAVEWGAQNGLSFSKDKTTVVFFSRQHKFHSEVLPRLKKLQINGHNINPSDSMTYLGIVLDQKLSWTPHIKKRWTRPKSFYI